MPLNYVVQMLRKPNNELLNYGSLCITGSVAARINGTVNYTVSLSYRDGWGAAAGSS